jgi:hypothetical protein
VLDDLDKDLTRRGHRFCRYADDCNIYVRSRRAGDRVMTSVSRYLTQQLRLKVNEAKSAVARPEERKFLGFSISNDGSERRIAPKALDKFKAKIRDLTCRTRGLSLQQIVDDLVPYLLGWRGTSASARPPACSRIWKRGSADDYGCIFGGSGRMDQIASKNSAAAASPSSTQRSPQARRRDSGVCQDTRRSNRPCGTTPSTPSVCPASMSPPKHNSVEPPWYGPVCPVVWELRRASALDSVA